MFVDQVRVFVKGGDGGRGCVSFRREAYVPRGGPDGGRGGDGGGVVLLAVEHQNTLLPLRYRSELRADRGRHGGPGNRTGQRGDDLVVAVPPGTEVFDDASGEPIGELLLAGARLVVAPGGRGGRGNQSFLSNRNRAPRESEPGEPGQERRLRLELRLIADVGLLGMPNAGKSTLLSCISSARPKIADYPFTTLHPVLGVVEVGDATFVAADIPGIIEGAHAGAGLGLQFLRHVQRTRVLLYVVDASGHSERDPVLDLRLLRRELELGAPELLARRQLLCATKRDAVAEEDPLPALLAEAEAQGIQAVAVSAVTGVGLPDLKRRLLVLCAPAEPDRLPESA